MKKFHSQKKISPEAIKELLPGVKKDIFLKRYTSFKIGGKAKYFFIARTEKDIISAVKIAKELNIPIFILGAGSNVLVSDKGFNGLIIKIENQKIDIKNSKAIIEAGAPLTRVASILADKELTGFEWASGIPGTIGGAIRGNAGAFGASMSDFVKTVSVLDCEKIKVKKINNAGCEFRYRGSVFKKKNFLIISCELNLEKGDKNKIKEKNKEYLDYRKTRHPKNPSAGSVFKNVPIKIIPKNFFKKAPEARQAIKENILPAGFLIAKAGLVGRKIGGAAISEKHANFIVNSKNAKAEDVKSLIKLVKRKIKNKFKIKLEEEIQYL